MERGIVLLARRQPIWNEGQGTARLPNRPALDFRFERKTASSMGVPGAMPAPKSSVRTTTTSLCAEMMPDVYSAMYSLASEGRTLNSEPESLQETIKKRRPNKRGQTGKLLRMRGKGGD